MKKTSIYLPESLVHYWLRERKTFCALLPKLLHSAQGFTPTRLRLRQKQETPENCLIVSVYWPIELYNELHGFAAATRVSVSLLIAHLLREMAAGVNGENVALQYLFRILSWNERRRAIREELRFRAIPPPLSP